MTKKEIEKAIDDSMEQCDNIIEAIENFLDSSVRELFDMDAFEQFDSNEKVIDYKNKKYKITIQEDGCCEATHEHRIMYWKYTIKEL